MFAAKFFNFEILRINCDERGRHKFICFSKYIMETDILFMWPKMLKLGVLVDPCGFACSIQGYIIPV